MYRHGPTSMSLYVAFALTAAALITAALVGCQKEEQIEVITLGSPALLFDDVEATPIASTDIGRSGWPSAQGPLESIEETYFYQYTRDYQGNAFQERNSPVRVFSSVRRGTQLR
ncbi:MAG: hypothetical protein IPK83_17665 [Planctomycetes bacterium]|nr:hypothetical protein [Planctomycetota bacterium]